MSRLIRRFEIYDTNDVQDMLSAMAANVEDALIESGAEPGKDYQILDVFKLAQPFVLEMFKSRESMTYTAGYPD